MKNKIVEGTPHEKSFPLVTSSPPEMHENLKILLSIIVDLNSIKSTCAYLKQNNQISENNILPEISWAATLIRYYRCCAMAKKYFGFKEKFFKEISEDAYKFHKYHVNMRDMHVAHSVNAFEQMEIGLVLTPPSGLKAILGISNLQMKLTRHSDPQAIHDLGCLAQFIENRLYLLITKQAEAYHEFFSQNISDSNCVLIDNPVAGNPVAGNPVAGNPVTGNPNNCIIIRAKSIKSKDPLDNFKQNIDILSSLFSITKELEYIQRTCDFITQHLPSTASNDQPNMLNIDNLWSYTLIAYRRCFNSGVRAPLTTEIFDGFEKWYKVVHESFNDDAGEMHESFSYSAGAVAHTSNYCDSYKACWILDKTENFRILNINFNYQVNYFLPTLREVQQMKALVTFILKNIPALINQQQETILREASALPIDTLYATELLKLEVPGPKKVLDSRNTMFTESPSGDVLDEDNELDLGGSLYPESSSGEVEDEDDDYNLAKSFNLS
ncbi:hypothetical protein [Legionella drancourtii]|uniref:Uncharacterized protein n=1 Tax=Legionella drancourtii LLAP12 TaxID=658187 RepID=G9ERV1_9GAMM|nr:hypothetical protein [Legionella drancourtii]EHL30019.1 hypothetical protein LDG_8019 [Legionella drancourtii LLAP12]